MKKMLILTIVVAAVGGNALADTFRLHYSIRGSGRDITIQADSPSEARRTVMDLIPGAVVTGCRHIGK